MTRDCESPHMCAWFTTCIAARIEGMAMHAMIDGTIERVEQLYTTLTGQAPPPGNGNGVAIPPEIDPLTHVEEQLSRMVAAAEQIMPSPTPSVSWMPRAVMWRDEQSVTITVDVPGVARDELQIRAEQCVISVMGVRRPPWSVGRPVFNLEACDTQLGLFARSFLLESIVVPEHVHATLADGVLTIRIDNTRRGEPSQIQIKSS